MNPQAYKDEVQPGEKAPARVENTIAFKYPPQRKKSKPHIVLFIIASACVLLGLLSLVIALSLPVGLVYPRGLLGYFVSFIGPLYGFFSGTILFLIGLIVYRINRKSR
jgi:hypothetical protein